MSARQWDVVISRQTVTPSGEAVANTTFSAFSTALVPSTLATFMKNTIPVKLEKAVCSPSMMIQRNMEFHFEEGLSCLRETHLLVVSLNCKTEVRCRGEKVGSKVYVLFSVSLHPPL